MFLVSQIKNRHLQTELLASKEVVIEYFKVEGKSLDKRNLDKMSRISHRQLTRMVVTMSVRLASESVMLLDLSLLPSVMLSPLLEFQIPIYTEHSALEAAGCRRWHLR